MEAHRFVGVVDRALVPLEAFERDHGHPLGELHGLGLQLGLGMDPADEAEAVGFPGIDDVARIDQVARPGADDEGHDHGRHAGGEMGFDHREFRIVRTESHVAHLGEFESARDAVAVDHRDHGLGAVPHAFGELEVVIEPVPPLLRGLLHALVALGDVVARRERPPAGAGNDEHADVVVGIGLGHRLLDVAAQLDRERVEIVGPVQRQDGDPLVLLVLQYLRCHGVSPLYINKLVYRDRSFVAASSRASTPSAP